MQPEEAKNPAKPEPIKIRIRKLDKIETTYLSNPSGN